MKFYELAIGAEFTFQGRAYRKVAMSLAVDEKDRSHILLGETEVVSDGPLLSPEEALQWKPSRGWWTEMIEELCRPGPCGRPPE